MYDELKRWAEPLGMDVTEEEFSWGEESGVEQITWKYQSSRLGSSPQYISCEKHADMPFYDFYSWLFVPERTNEQVFEYIKARFDTFKKLLQDKLAKV